MSKIPSDHNLYKPNPGLSTDKSDFNNIQWGREQNAGFIIGRSSFPVFFTADGHNVHLQDMYRGASVMLLFGKSKATDDEVSSVMSWSIDTNKFNSNLITLFSDELKSLKQLRDPRIKKVLPMSSATKRVQDKVISHNPNCFYFVKHAVLNHASFLTEETVWFNGSSTSKCLAGIKLAYITGFRSIFVSGAEIEKVDDINKIIDVCQKFGLKIFFTSKIEGLNADVITHDDAVRRCILS